MEHFDISKPIKIYGEPLPELKMSFVNFVETWLNQEPRKFQDEFENDVFLLLEYYGVEVKRDEKGKVIRLGKLC